MSRPGVVVTFFTAWLMGLVTYVTVQVFQDPAQINAATNVALGTVYALPALVVGLLELRVQLFKWIHRESD